MVEIEIIEIKKNGLDEKGYDKWEGKIKIDGTEIDIDEYNKKHHYGNINGLDNDFFERAKKAAGLYNELYGSFPGLTNEQNKVEWEKNDKVNPGLREEIRKLEKVGDTGVDRTGYDEFRTISGSQLGNHPDAGIKNAKTVIEHNNKLWDDNLDRWKRINSLKFELKKEKDETGQIPGEEYNSDWEKDKKTKEELDELRNSAIEEINQKLNSEPKVSSTDLNSPNWEKIIKVAISETRINEIKKEILADISTKRAAKQGKHKREDGENENTNDNPNKKPKVDNEEKDGWDALKNSTLEGVKDNEIASGLKLATRMEGEEEFKDEAGIKRGEEELIKRNPQLYMNTIIDALQERINDNGVSMNDLSEETRQLIGNEITDIEKFKEAKDRVIKEIGEVGAKSKWNSLFNKAQALFQKAKQSVTEQVKKDLKAIQKQLKSLKDKSGGANSYLTNFYQNDKSKFDKLEKDLSNHLSEGQTGSPNETPWGIIIPVSLVALSLIGIAAAIIVRKRNKAKRIVE